MMENSVQREKEIEIVKRLSGVSDESRIEVSEIGWTSRVYLVDKGKIVFKFPRTPEFRSECAQEVAVLEVLKKHRFNVGTPVLAWTAHDNEYFGFYGVEGKPLKDAIRTLPDQEKRAIGTQIGQFLKQLHSITDYGEARSQTLEEQIVEYSEMYRADRGLLETFFSESELSRIDDFFADDVVRCMGGGSDLVFSHGDLDCNNVLVDDENQVGVIDFGDAGLYDRSQDFRGMDDRVVRTAMMEAYGGGEILSLEAAEATAKMIDVLNVPYLIKNRSAAERDECVKRIKEWLLR
ncbi:aminoglycoside phosphotransferase family protein [Raoultibacter phocaeensis]|uniref:aminoglycoside phosphotransferase family protein n=1 Tax=Raoultibacter phocaeensis TaxID=2479841 RepID=UPI001119575A|nr:aminoglycoside phosphotransferase family protein [Raoultibacter phocaeensis]